MRYLSAAVIAALSWSSLAAFGQPTLRTETANVLREGADVIRSEQAANRLKDQRVLPILRRILSERDEKPRKFTCS
jgi:hypothetical protein